MTADTVASSPTSARSLGQMEARAEEAAEFLSSMANPKRLLVLCHLLSGERSVGEMAAIANLSSSALSQHLTKMRLQGLVKTRRDAQTIYYSIACPNVQKVLETLYAIYCAE